MELTCGQKVVVQAPDTDAYVNGRIISFFHLTEDDAAWLRRKNQTWAHVRAGDRAFHYQVLEQANNNERRSFTPRIFVLGYADVYLCMR